MQLNEALAAAPSVCEDGLLPWVPHPQLLEGAGLDATPSKPTKDSRQESGANTSVIHLSSPRAAEGF
jgi:hypothetical protein